MTRVSKRCSCVVTYQPEERYHRGSLEVGIQEAWLGGLGEAPNLSLLPWQTGMRAPS